MSRTDKGHFKKGLTPHNKGKKWEDYMSEESIERAKKGQFKKGQLPHNTKPEGYERFDKDGYTLVKTEGKFVLKHRKIWEEHYGKIPKGYIVVFKDNNRQNFDIENLECITNYEIRLRNRNPKDTLEVKKLNFQRSLLKKKIKELENGKK